MYLSLNFINAYGFKTVLKINQWQIVEKLILKVRSKNEFKSWVDITCNLIYQVA